MKRALLIVLFFAGAPVGYAKPPVVGPLPELKFTPREPERHVLSNGVVVYLIEDHELPLISLSLKMKTSPADEAESQVGLLGLFGTVWRAGGTASRSAEKLNEELEHMATTVETTASHEAAAIALDTLSKNRAASLALFADVLLSPRFDEAQVVLAKGKTLEALRRKNDDPATIGRRAFRDIIYGERHVYAREPNEESLKNISRKDLVRLHSTVIVPDNAILTAAGDFESKVLIGELENLFKLWKPSGRTLPTYDFAVKNPKDGGLFYVEKAVNQSRVTVGRVGVARHHPDHFRLAVADYILGGGGASRLFGQIRSRLGLAYAVGSFVSEPEGPGIIAIGAQTKAASTVQIIKAIRGELEKFNSIEPTAEELKLAKDAITNSFIFNFDSPASIASQKADLEFLGYSKLYLDTYLDNIRSVSGADILKTARAYYSPSQMKILVVGDKSKFGVALKEAGDVVEIPLESIR